MDSDAPPGHTGTIHLIISDLLGGIYLVRFVQTSNGAIMVSKTLKLAVLR